jgi:hypothetical protein
MALLPVRILVGLRRTIVPVGFKLKKTERKIQNFGSGGRGKVPLIMGERRTVIGWLINFQIITGILLEV